MQHRTLIRNWPNFETVTLDPERDAIIRDHSVGDTTLGARTDS
jgi:hypothetical protein